MPFSNIITIIQTSILFLTGLVVLWYTYETYKIRKETNEQNSLLAEQLLLMQKSQKYEMEKDLSYMEPIFRKTGGHHNKKEAHLIFINQGALAKKMVTF